METLLAGNRRKAAFIAGGIGLLMNFVLGSVKVYIGWASHSISVMGDGFNNITDMGSVVLLLMTFYYAAKPSDPKHPFGYGRLEYINTTVMAAVVLYVGITLMVESVHKMMNPEPITFSYLLLGILLFSIVGKLLLACVYKKTGKALKSDTFMAYSADSLSDMLSTFGVLAAILIERFLGLRCDGIMGAIMSLFILYTGYSILKTALNSIIGTMPDEEVYDRIRDCILQAPGVYGVHDLIVHDYGPENHFATAHIELDSKMGLVESHELAERVMERLRDEMHIQAVIHADPRAVSNPKEKEYKRDLEAALYRSRLPVTYHDFFVEEKEDTIYVSFELALTGACRLADEDIYKTLSAEIKKINPDYHVELMVDRNYVSGKRFGVIEE